jgi:hypothetical protein
LGFSLPKPVKFSFSLGKAIATETQPHLPRPSLNHPPALTKTKEPLPFFPSHLLAKPRDPALQWWFACFCIILKVFLFTWQSNCHRDPATTFLVPLSIIPLPWPKLKSPSLFFPATYWPNQETQLFNGDLLVFALFLFSSNIKGLKIKQHKPFIYVLLF